MYRNAINTPMIVGFGTGDTMVVLKDEKSISTIIAARNNDKKEAPLSLPRPALRTTSMERVLGNLEIIYQEVHENQELIFLTDGAYEDAFNTIGTAIEEDPALFRRTIANDEITYNILNGNVVAEVDKKVKEEFDKIDENVAITMGDDASVATLSIGEAIAAESQFQQMFISPKQPEDVSYLQNNSRLLLTLGVSLLLAGVVIGLGIAFFPPLLVALPFLGKAAAAISAFIGITISAEVVLGGLIAVAALAAGTIGSLLTKVGFVINDIFAPVDVSQVADHHFTGISVPNISPKEAGNVKGVTKILANVESSKATTSLQFGPAHEINRNKRNDKPTNTLENNESNVAAKQCTIL